MKTILFLFLLPSISSAAVDLLNGSYVYRVRIPPELTLQYNSRNLWPTHLGFGWCARWTTQLEIQGPGRYRLRDCQGDLLLQSQASQTGQGERILSSYGDELRITGPFLWLFRKDGTRIKFSNRGLILEREHQTKTESFDYDAIGRLRRWRFEDQTMLFSYSGLQREVRAFSLRNGASVRLVHRFGNLELVRIEGGKTLRFEYDDLNNLTIIRDGDQALEEIEYERTLDLVKSVRLVLRHENWIFEYRKGGANPMRVKKFHRESGRVISIYSFEDSGLLTRLQRRWLRPDSNPLRAEQTLFTYRDDHSLNSIRTSSGDKIEFIYDESGRLQDLRSPRSQGGDLAMTKILQGALEQLDPLSEGDLVL